VFPGEAELTLQLLGEALVVGAVLPRALVSEVGVAGRGANTRRSGSLVSGGHWLQRRAAGAVCALLLLAMASWPAAADEPSRLTTILLVARDKVSDPNFGGSVVLVMNHVADGPVGVIVNRPTRMSVAELFPDMKRLAAIEDKVYFGGPVEFGTVWFLFRAAKRPARSVRAFEDVYLSGNRELLFRLLRREKPMENLRIFVGHSGWAPGQLEAEIGRGDWMLEHAEKNAVFEPDAERPWPAPPEPEVSI
jgi:putative transcriptional regulator